LLDKLTANCFSNHDKMLPPDGQNFNNKYALLIYCPAGIPVCVPL